MKKNNIKRCPWCGSKVDKLGLKNQTIKKCLKCNHKYTYGDTGFGDSNGKKYIRLALRLIAFICLTLSVFNPIFYVLMLILTALSFAIGYDELNYTRYDDSERFTYKKYIAEIRFNSDYTKKEIKLLLSNDNIFPICFVDNNQQPISNDICISVEDAKKTHDNLFEFTLSFLPLSEVKYSINEFNVKFICYDNGIIVGEGKVLKESTKF